MTFKIGMNDAIMSGNILIKIYTRYKKGDDHSSEAYFLFLVDGRKQYGR